MKNPQVGDRVKIYGFVRCEVNPNSLAFKRGEPGEIVQAIFKDEITVKTKFGKTEVHPKQCRRLKVKKKMVKKRQEVWANVYECGLGCIYHFKNQAELVAESERKTLAHGFIEWEEEQK